MSVVKKKPVVLRNIVADMKDFDWEVYLLNYPELFTKGVRTRQDAYNHYKNIGFWEKRSSRVPEKFNSTSYIQAHGHLGIKTPREAYLHFMRVGKVVRRNEGFRQNIRPYRLPIATQRRPTPLPQTTTNVATNTAPSPPPPQKPAVVARRIFQPSVIKRKTNTPMKPSFQSFIKGQNKHVVKQPKPGQLVLPKHVSPSSYFQKHYKLGPPKYLN